MKNILLILVGGTICTSKDENSVLSVDENAGTLIKSNFINSDSPYAKKVNIDLTENLFILSENMTVEKWNILLNTYRKYTKDKQYDGIIFAHGTDTLAYTASLFSMLLSGTKIPVFFVSSHRRLTVPTANGNDNFRYAAECIARGISPNVYVTYKNPSDKRMYLHLASRLEQCKNYTDDFYSKGMLNITEMCDENYTFYFKKIAKMYPHEKISSPINIYDNFELSECILPIEPYVGINYNSYNYSSFKAVLHRTYHSGTVCADGCDENSILHMINQCSSCGTDTYIAPSKTWGDIYESVAVIKKSKINFLYGSTFETAYAKLLIAYSVFESDREKKEYIYKECNFEIIDKG